MRFLTLATALGLAVAVTVGGAAAKTFRYAYLGDVNTLDPYSFDETVQLGFLGNIYEPLVARSTPEMKLEPGLATEWTLVEPNRWRFKLRRGVKFHDGTPFSAEDVAFSVERGQQKTAQAGYRVAGVKTVIVDDYTIDFVTATPNPLLINGLFYFYTMSKSWAEKNNATITGGLGAQGRSGADISTNGTGPFRLVRREADVETVVEPNPDWWGEKHHNITQAVFRPIKADATRIAALLSGEVDMISPVPIQDIDRLEHTPDVSVLSGPEVRAMFLAMDQSRDELLYSDVKGRNPFKDVRVRKAIYQAIDLDGIIRTVLRGQGTPALAPALSPVVYGYPTDGKRLPYDPAAAKALLVAAGYAGGFGVTLDCTNDRYVKDEAICVAIASMLAKVDIRVTVNAQTKGKFFPKITSAENFDTSFAMFGFGPGNFDASSIQQLILACRGSGQGVWNVAGFCDPEMDAIWKRLVVEADPRVRDPLMHKVWDRVRDGVLYIPLHLQNLSWGVRKGVKVIQRPDDVVVLNYVTME